MERMKTLSMDGRRMRLHNSEHVLLIVKTRGPLSRAEIARQSRLSAPTVAAVISDLVRAGMVEESGEGESTGGRRPQLVSFNSRFGAVIGMNIGTTAVRLVLADMRGEWLAKREVRLEEETRPKPLLRKVADAVTAMCKEELGSNTPVLAMMIGAPGMTDMTRGVVIEAANLDGWVNVPVRETLEQKLGAPVIVDNDVNLAAIGEHWQGGARGLHNFVFIMMGTGIGASVVIADRIHRGHSWNAGEISHMNLDFSKWETDYGAAGYLETQVGARPRKQTKRSPRLHDDILDDQALILLGAAVGNIATIIDPEAVFFGGRAAVSQPEMLNRVAEVASKIAPNCSRILLTELGEDAPLFGSVKLALDHVEESLQDILASKTAAAA